MSTTFYLFRHGLATKHSKGYGAHIQTTPILPEAVPVIEKMANYLSTVPADYFASSSYIRCIQTAKIISQKTNTSFVIDPRLNEYHNITYQEFVNNITSFLKEIKSKNYKHVFICTHVAVIVATVHLLCNQTLEEKDLHTNNPMPGVLTIISDGKKEEKNFS